MIWEILLFILFIIVFIIFMWAINFLGPEILDKIMELKEDE